MISSGNSSWMAALGSVCDGDGMAEGFALLMGIDEGCDHTNLSQSHPDHGVDRKVVHVESNLISLFETFLESPIGDLIGQGVEFTPGERLFNTLSIDDGVFIGPAPSILCHEIRDVHGGVYMFFHCAHDADEVPDERQLMIEKTHAEQLQDIENTAQTTK